MDRIEPLAELREWIEDARRAGAPQPASVAFVTVGVDGRPSARTVTLKRLEDDALVFTTALWTRKAKEIEANPHVALLFHWPALGRQALPASPEDWGALRVRRSAAARLGCSICGPILVRYDLIVWGAPVYRAFGSRSTLPPLHELRCTL